MRIGFFGGLGVDGATVTGVMQRALLFRLAIDAGTVVATRTLVDDLWPDAAPENARGALQSIVSRLRSQLPLGAIESDVGGYRLAVARDDVDVLAFQDLVSAAAAAGDAALATRALALWRGEPWHPEGFEWFGAELLGDRMRALELGGAVLPPVPEAPEVPAALTDLIGREAELALVRSQLASSRAVTIIGPGGAGKTSLALAVARARDHALFVELAPVGHAEVWPAVLGASGRDLRLGDAPTAVGTEERVIAALGGRELLLVLDNCEHLVDEASHVVAELLRALPRLRVLATSREPLGVVGEAFVAIGALERPDALELFELRAVAARGRGLDDEERRLASVVCDRLDRLALAIELAAARLRTMTLAELASGLDDRFALLASGPRSALPRHQTLWSLIDWSWDLLDDDERRALCALAAFPAGVATGAGLERALGLSGDVFDRLVDRSLVQRTQGRFRMLETIREYGLERLARDGQLEGARARQAEFMADAALLRDAMLRTARIHDGIAWFDAEEDNMVAALRYAVDAPLPSVAVRLAAASAWYWTVRDRHLDAISWLDQVLAFAAAEDSDEATIVSLMGHLSRSFSGDTAWGDPSGEEQRARDAIAMASIEPVGAGGNELLQVLGPLLSAFAASFGNESWPFLVDVPDGEALGLDPWPTAILHVMRAAMAENRGDIATEGESSRRALEMFEQIGDQWGLALARQIRSEWLSLSGRLEEALEMTDLSSEGMREITSAQDALQQQGLSLTILLRLGREHEAQQRAQAILEAARDDGGSRLMVQASVLASTVALARDDLDAARAHLATADELIPEWPGIPPQLLAGIEVTRGSILGREGRLDEALAALRGAAETAISSGDHPVIAQVALGFGELALARDEPEEAFRALELAAACRGVLETADPRVSAILAAIGDDGRRELAEAGSRPLAVEGLRELLA